MCSPHLRPIVKSVEFGAKVNNILVNEISLMEKLFHGIHI